jgi:cytochrome c553
MKGEALFSLRNRWFTASIAITAAIALVAGGFGFVWLPMMERNAQFATLWDAICSAAGAPRATPASGPIVAPTVVLSHVVLTPGLLASVNPEAVGRGATLALRCTMCHGARGLSEANSPNLAGQYAAAMYKQLQDFKSGARESAVMSPLARDLSGEDMRELAAYYAYLPRPPWPEPRRAPAIVESGAPLRGIAPCGTCHGAEAHKLGSPRLEGEPVAYLRAQLQAFKNGARHNDIEGIMRNVARPMSDGEIEAAARYYGVQE